MLSAPSIQEHPDEPGANSLRAAHGVRVPQGVPEMRGEVSPQASAPALLLLGPVSGDELRPAHLPGEPPRRRGLSWCRAGQALPHGIPCPGGASHPRRCQRAKRLADLRRVRAEVDHRSPPALHRRTLRRRTGTDRLRLGRHHHRSLPVGLSLGPVPKNESRHQAPHPSRPPWQHPCLHLDHRCQGLRRTRARPADPRAGIDLPVRPRLCGLPAAVSAYGRPAPPS